MRVRFTTAARNDIVDISTGIGQTDSVRALDTVIQIEKAAEGLAMLPFGYPVVRTTPSGDVRKKNSPPYMLLYRVVPAAGIEVLAVVHERSNWVVAVRLL